ncbi:MAG: hypothetical protein L6R38_005385 [Xanthoria sp. 2 TBL-2021]|nr:MAG: hypothetical protein L6R38_005385 [Xanthoria sp. 2 TBL-2021]
MLSHSENQSAAHGPTRYSSLRQVTSTNEQPDTDLSKHGHLQSSLWDNTLQLTDQPNRKVFTLGVHDGFSTASIALFDLSAFPRNSIGSGSPITIAPASEIDLAIEEDSPSGNVEFTSRGSLVSERRDGKSKYLFVAEPMDPDMITKSPGVQISISSSDATRCGLKAHTRVVVSTIDHNDHRASHVEIAFRDEYLSRSDMWRLAVSELAGKVVHKGQRLSFMGTIKVAIKAIYIRGRKVPSALFSAATKPIFRSESARYVLFIQMSKEMWDFDADGTGEIMFDKVVNGFLPDLFKRWQKIKARHLVTIVMFTRLEFSPAEQTGLLTFGRIVTDKTSAGAASRRDFYRVVVSDMPSAEWSEILVQLKREFRVFLKDVSIHTCTSDPTMTSEGPPETSGGVPSHAISGSPSPALRGNILEAVNLASSQFSCDYIDRDLVRTGVSVIVITPGTGIFEVDYNLLATTTDNLIENGVGIDLVCLSRLPLHSVPLFKYRPTPPCLPRGLNESSQLNKEPLESRMSRQLEKEGEPITGRNYWQGDEMLSRNGAIKDLQGEDWKYGIPHWVDVSFWTSTNEGNGPFPFSHVGNGHRLTLHGQLRRKPFVPRARMYELQMMGVMENSLNQIRLPLLSKSTLRRNRKSTAPSSLPLSTPPSGRRKSSHGDSMFRQPAGGSLQTPASSVTSRNNFLQMSKRAQYRWMDDYDETLFCHPRQRLAAASDGQPPVSTTSPAEREQQHNRLTPASGFQISAGTEQSGKLRDRAHPSLSNPAPKDNTSVLKLASPSNSHTTTPPSTLLPKAPKLSRRTSLGFRGFGASTSKATASTGISVEHANPTEDHQHRAAKKSSGTLTGLLNSKPSIRQAGTVEADAYLAEFSGGTSSARPIPIRHPTEIRISSKDLHSQGRNNNSTMTPQRSDSFRMSQNPQQPDGLLSQAVTPTRNQQISPMMALAPWLTVINPSNPHQTDSDSTSRLGRWQHIFPRKLRASKMKWKSLCSPAAVPLTTEVFPSAEELATSYDSSTYKLNLPRDDELLEHPRSRHHWLLREMMAFRFSQGFQVVVGLRLAESLYLPNSENFDVFDDDRLSQTDMVIIMTKGSMIHKISTAEFGHVEVECMTRRSITAQTTVADIKSDAYQPMVRTMLADDYAVQSIAITSRQPKLDWNLLDSRIAGHQKLDSDKQDDNIRSWRARLVLIPVPPASCTQLPFPSRSEDTEEELRLEGIKKLTQMWQRFRYVPPSERRFQASSTRRRKDDNPLDIIYLTKNPSDIVATEKDNIGEEMSSGKPVQLLPESELFQRSNLNLPLLAQTIQGEKGVRMMDRRWHLILHYNCFIGFELTSWLLQNFRDVGSREEAVELGNDLMQNGLFVHVKGRHTFRDGNYFYQVASDYRSARPESRNSWFGSRRAADKSIPSTPISEGPRQESPKAPGSRSSSAGNGHEHALSAATDERRQLGIALSKSLLYDVDHRKRSYRPELITLHYDRLHNPDNCYHIRIDWLNVTSKFIEDVIVSWAALVERFGLKLVEVPLAEASAITSMHPFRAPTLVKLAKSPPLEHPPTMLLDATSFTPQRKIEKRYYQKEIMKRFEFILDFEAASDFPADVDVTYSWGKPDYRYPQYVHRSGTVLAQITNGGDFLLLANRLYNDRSPGAQDAAPACSEETPGKEGPGKSNRFSSARSGNHRGSPRISPYASPLVRAAADPRAPPTTKTPSTFAIPERIKKEFEDFCADAEALDAFYTDVVKTAAMPPPSTPQNGTPLMESSIPTLGLPPPSLMLRDRSPGAEIGQRKTRNSGGDSPSLTPRRSGDMR